MKNYILFLFLIISSCNSTTSQVEPLAKGEEQFLNRENKIINLYTTAAVPLFNDYKCINIPAKLQVDEKDYSINAGAAIDYIEISRGLINLESSTIQLFVLAHELAHIATLSQAKSFGLPGEIPAGKRTNEYKKAEYLADLIAFHLILKQRPEDFNFLKSNFSFLISLLGNGDFTHPSGQERIASIKKYILETEEQNIDIAFKNRFNKIFYMN
ncbi:hypothetical protein GUB10_15245 [Salegentibacter sp. BLCTC]|uniref:hypothetical protein n=1 Tax=Salegentibacter sp. BLCTC TaxID=2697368 RepID=UPI00187B20A0|nr:hypothetical protein [Salegentibacter sp. BLCTC]MBE7641690.1 hypothetical protein [Salegentibacter sp. BLCTC]